ncbi:MAG: hypothetical protein IJ660_05510 [Alphaproteobacteria bacterium]|nr:hypothetical protein [Alphaproteobacteria bacterium]
MEHYIEGRVILGLLCLIHAFAGCALQVPWGHLNKKVLNGFFITELVAVTAYIIYDNLQTPPHDGWTLAIIGYLFVYAWILMTWAGYSIYTALDVDKTYKMRIKGHVRFMNEDYFRGTVMDGRSKVEVLLPYAPELISSAKAGRKQKVKFDKFLRDFHILVKLAKT